MLCSKIGPTGLDINMNEKQLKKCNMLHIYIPKKQYIKMKPRKMNII